MNNLLRKGGEGSTGERAEKMIQSDQKLRRAVAELYISLEELNNPAVAVDVLSEHTAILVEMIHRFKSRL
jgi:hypothetical protein